MTLVRDQHPVQTLRPERLSLSKSPSAVSALPAAIRVYGLLAYIVVERTQEIRTRMALGGQRFQVMRSRFVEV